MNIKLIRLVILLVLLVLVILGVVKVVQYFRTPTSTISLNQASVIKEMKSLNRLETASFTLEKVIEAGTDGNAFQDILFGDRILLIAHADIIAGFDLSKLGNDDITVDGTSLNIKLPAPEILVSKLDNEQTRVYDRKQGLLAQGDKDLESKARLAAENSIREAACKGGILDVASENARTQLQTTYSLAGFKEVTVYIPQAVCK